MSVVSFQFFVFLAIVVSTYYFCVKKYRWLVLLAASASYFLSISTPAQMLVFIGMSMLTFLAALVIKRSQSEEFKKAITIITLIVLVAILIRYKEITFIVSNFNRLTFLAGLSWGITLPDWVAPLGISYYTLILIGYLLDVRWGNVLKPQKNPFKFLLFAGYFPHMISGPFSRYNDIGETLFSGVEFSFKNIWFGLQRVIWGVFKVLVISTRVSVFVKIIFNAQALPVEQNLFRGIGVVAGAVLYVLNVYMNFSGSMDIVIGVSEMFGVPLAENFQRPFSATSLSEVWRKWHISLGFWLKDYVMYPTQKALTSRFGKATKKLFGKKAGKDIILYSAMLVVWFCVGFWHGGSWKYIFGSGLFFFIMITGGLILQPLSKRLITLLHINTTSAAWHLFQKVRTLLLFAFSVSFGRADSFMAGLHMWRNAFRRVNLTLFTSEAWRNIVINDMGLTDLTDGIILAAITAISVAIVFAVSCLQERFGSIRVLMKKSRLLNIILILALLVATFCIGGFDNSVDFIYGNF